MTMDLSLLKPTRAVLLRIALSVILAVILWGWVTSLADPDETRSSTNVPVSYGVPGDGLVVSTTEIVASVTATGPASIMEDFTSGNLALTLDLDGIDRPGTYTVAIVPAQEERFIDYRISPSTASIVVDEMVSRVLPIVIQTVPEDLIDRQVIGQQLSVPEVTVSGPRSIMETINVARIDIDISGQTGEFTDQYQVSVVTTDGNQFDSTTENVNIAPSVIEATLDVQSIGREVTILASVTGSPAEGYEERTSTTTPRTVILAGSPQALASLTFVETEPVDITGAVQNVSVDIGLANLPEGVVLVEPANGLVSVIVQIQQQSVDQTLPSLPVTLTGLGPGLTATLTPAEVSIEISASSAQVPDLVNGAIVVSVDVTGLAPGTYALTPRIVVPAGVEWDSVVPARIDVTIVADSAATAPALTIGTPGASP